MLTTITESITINAETETITVRLRPVFEHLRLAKQSFMADLERLNGTLQTRSDRAKQALQNIRPEVSQFIDYGTRKKLLNTKIEPNFDDSIEINVEGGTCLARSRLTGLRFFFSETLFLPKKRPSPSAHSR